MFNTIRTMNLTPLQSLKKITILALIALGAIAVLTTGGWAGDGTAKGVTININQPLSGLTTLSTLTQHQIAQRACKLPESPSDWSATLVLKALGIKPLSVGYSDEQIVAGTTEANELGEAEVRQVDDCKGECDGCQFCWFGRCECKSGPPRGCEGECQSCIPD